MESLSSSNTTIIARLPTRTFFSLIMNNGESCACVHIDRNTCHALYARVRVYVYMRERARAAIESAYIHAGSIAKRRYVAPVRLLAR